MLYSQSFLPEGSDLNKVVIDNIVAWFAETENPIENREDIKEIQVVGDRISFWYKDKCFRDCPLCEKKETDTISLVPWLSADADILVMRVLHSVDECFGNVTPQEDGFQYFADSLLI